MKQKFLVNKIFLILFIITTCCLQSCFEIVEQIQLKNNGSGNFQLTVNFSKSKTKLNSMMKMETINGHPVPTKATITARAKELEKVIIQTPGISNVKTDLDFENYIAVISYNFSNVTQLNKAIKNIKVKENTSANLLADNFAYNATSKEFERKNKIALKSIYGKMSNADKEIFANANYTSIYKFDSEIIGSTNPNANISASKKAIMIKETALDIMKEKKSIENKINLSK